MTREGEPRRSTAVRWTATAPPPTAEASTTRAPPSSSTGARSATTPLTGPGGRLWRGDQHLCGRVVSLRASEVDGNTASGSSSLGGGIANFGATLNATRSTISKNVASSPGGTAQGGGLYNVQSATTTFTLSGSRGLSDGNQSAGWGNLQQRRHRQSGVEPRQAQRPRQLLPASKHPGLYRLTRLRPSGQWGRCATMVRRSSRGWPPSSRSRHR